MRRANETGAILAPMTQMESTQFAAEQIRGAIIAGHFKPGDRLVEQQLTDMLHVSRHPVREALRLLAREGFVELKRNKGASVRAVDADSVIEVYNIRIALGKIALDHLLAGAGRLASVDIKRLEKLAENAVKFANLDSQAAVPRGRSGGRWSRQDDRLIVRSGPRAQGLGRHLTRGSRGRRLRESRRRADEHPNTRSGPYRGMQTAGEHWENTRRTMVS